MKVPNVLTLSRLCLAPAFLAAFLSESPAGRWWALALALFFEATDLIDGYLARRLGQTSTLGKVLDPLADSVSRFTIFLGFLSMGYGPVWSIACIFWRDSIVSTMRILAASQGVIVSARFSGKVKAIVQGAAIILLLGAICLHDRFGWTLETVKTDLAPKVMWFVAGVTLWSLVDYLVGNRRVLARLDV